MSDTNELPQLPFAIKWAATGFVRHAMVGVGTALLAKGVFANQDAANQFIDWGVSGVFIIGGLLWSLLNERAKSAATKQGA